MAEGYHKFFIREGYQQLTSQLLNYRLDSFIRAKEETEGKNKGLIFPFARGLRFSALLIYAIRERLSGTDLEANWGQIIEGMGQNCSGECDIIIHKKGHVRKWNGGDGGNHVMDFRFIKKENALAVISCKSYLTKSAVEKDYCVELLKYVSKVWLFAECCGPESVDLIKEESKNIGYEHFWFLYTWSRTKGSVATFENEWESFLETVDLLKNN